MDYGVEGYPGTMDYGVEGEPGEETVKEQVIVDEKEISDGEKTLNSLKAEIDARDEEQEMQELAA